MLKVMAAQACKDHIPKNRPPNERVGLGIYCTPHLQTALKDYTDKSDKYALIFQCRVNPK